MSFRRSDIFLFISLIFIILNSIAFDVPYSDLFYYCSILFLFLFTVLRKLSNPLKINYFLIIFILFLFFNIIINNVDDVFKPYKRLASFTFIIIAIGPFFSNSKIFFSRFRFLTIFNKIIVFLSALSYLLYISNIYVGKQTRGDLNYRPDFTGLFGHSMILSPISSLSILYLFYIFTSQKLSRRQILFYIIVIIICFLSLVTSGSRMSFLALLISITFLLFKKFKSNFLVFSKYFLLISSIIILTFPIWQDNASFMIDKMRFDDVSSTEDLTLSRANKWNSRLIEFDNAPFIGIGFSSVDINGFDNFDRDTGQIEPGSSWLSLLSMTGLIGFFSFLFINFKIYKNISENNLGNYIKAVLLFFYLSFLTEGYIFASGSILFFYYWMILGISYGLNHLKRFN